MRLSLGEQFLRWGLISIIVFWMVYFIVGLAYAVPASPIIVWATVIIAEGLLGYLAYFVYTHSWQGKLF